MSLSEHQGKGAIVLRGVGLDAFWNALGDYEARSIRMDEHDLYSLVDLMSIFGKNTSNPRRYWSDNKKSLLDGDPELYEKIVQLKARASDGKMYATDFAPRWVCLYIVLGMKNPAANALRKLAAKALDGMTKAAVKYRALNVDNGMEWAADTVHEEIAELEPPDNVSAFEDMGYRRDKADRFAPPDTDRDRHGRNEL